MRHRQVGAALGLRSAGAAKKIDLGVSAGIASSPVLDWVTAILVLQAEAERAGWLPSPIAQFPALELLTGIVLLSVLVFSDRRSELGALWTSGCCVVGAFFWLSILLRMGCLSPAFWFLVALSVAMGMSIGLLWSRPNHTVLRVVAKMLGTAALLLGIVDILHRSRLPALESVFEHIERGACELGVGYAPVVGGCLNLASRFKDEDPRSAEFYLRSCYVGEPLSCDYLEAVYASLPDRQRTSQVAKHLAASYPKAAAKCNSGFAGGCFVQALALANGVGVAKNEPQACQIMKQACASRPGLCRKR